MRQLLPRKTVAEIVVAPSLRFYDEMVSIGEHLLEKMGTTDWQRRALSLEIQDRVKLQRVNLEYNRFFFEFDSEPDSCDSLVHNVDAYLVDTMVKFNMIDFQHVGFRQWWAIEIDGNDEKKLISKMSQHFLQLGHIEELSTQFQFEDAAQTLEFRDQNDPGKTCRIITGAMERDQWALHVPYATPDRGGTHLLSNGFETIKDSLPSDFVFVDVDFRLRCNGADKEVVCEFFKSAATRSEATAKTMLQKIRAINLEPEN
ncbi:hypothetical protein ACFL2H_00445 [Planctomycetota bacterium]